MSRDESPFAFIATCFASLYVVLIVLFAPEIARAQGPEPASRVGPPFASYDLRATLDDNDEIATLDAIHVALSEVGDGATYVWQRLHGRLSGTFKPTQSFKDSSGNICRHLIIQLVAGRHAQRAEGIACRLANGRWQLDG